MVGKDRIHHGLDPVPLGLGHTTVMRRDGRLLRLDLGPFDSVQFAVKPGDDLGQKPLEIGPLFLLDTGSPGALDIEPVTSGVDQVVDTDQLLDIRAVTS